MTKSITEIPEFYRDGDVTYFFLFELYKSMMKIRPDIRGKIFEISKDLYKEYIKSDEWKFIADFLKEEVGFRCQICNRHKDEVSLNCHHRTYDHLGLETIGDLIILCEDCHNLYHKRLPEYN